MIRWLFGPPHASIVRHDLERLRARLGDCSYEYQDRQRGAVFAEYRRAEHTCERLVWYHRAVHDMDGWEVYEDEEPPRDCKKLVRLVESLTAAAKELEEYES